MTDSLADVSDSPADELDDWQDSDYDGAWKEALVEQLPDFLRHWVFRHSSLKANRD